MANYFSSDWHFGHESITEWERTQFNTIEEHNQAIIDAIYKCAAKMKKGDTFYFLGDFGNPGFLAPAMISIIASGAKTIFVAGNHDKLADKEIFEKYFDEVYWHPIYLSERLLVSHFPQAVWPGQINIHGHLHGMKLNDPHYITCSINDTDYRFITDKHVNSAFSKIEKYDTRFLFEPWAEMYQVTKRDTSDLVVDKDGNLDVSSTRAYWKCQGWLDPKEKEESNAK